jgi:hypothetical protein
MASTAWTNWPIAERQSPPGGPASEMNERFFQSFHDRDENLRSRLCPGDNLSAQMFGLVTGAWTPIGASSVIWIPAWAERLVVRCWMKIHKLGGIFDVFGYARPKLGAVYGTEMQVGATTPVPSFFITESAIEIPDAMRDTEQVFTYEVRRFSLQCEYVWVFNDARDAALGTNHRQWLFQEAS